MKHFLAQMKDSTGIDAPQGTAPEWFQVFPAGQVLIDGAEPAVMDAEAAGLVMAQFAAAKHDMVIDYEHQTLTGERAPAAGWIKALEWREGDGLWARAEWTDVAAAHIARREYRYHSPVFLARKSDRKIVSLYNVALTNQPKMMNVAALAAKQALTAKKETAMWKKVLQLLGLAEDAGEDKAAEALKQVIDENAALKAEKAKADEVVACKEVLEALKLPADAGRDVVLAAVRGAGATGDAAKELSLEVAKLRTEISQMKQADLVAEALKHGQTSPEELDRWGRKLALESPEQFRLIVLSRPKGSVIPVDGAPPAPPGRGDAADAAQLEINKQMGIDEETWKQFGPKTA